MKYLLGYDVGNFSVKAALLDVDTGRCVASATGPAGGRAMGIQVPQPGWAEQNPERWWQEIINATHQLQSQNGFYPDQVAAIGITYQMHGLVLVDKAGRVLRPAIIGCDSRAVALGDQAFSALGEQFCLDNYLNSPGNFTASKLKWVRENEPELYDRIDKIQLPGDYIAFKLTGELQTTLPGLSEGVFWNFKRQAIAQELLDYYALDAALLPKVVDTFAVQGLLTVGAAQALGLAIGTPVSYRAGDQPNNAFALNVLHPGEVAAAAGTSGVVYGISDQLTADRHSRVNSFVHVTTTAHAPRQGVLLCLNGTGIPDSWLRQLMGKLPYDQLNQLAAQAPVGAAGLRFLPFGNGAERMLQNRPAAAGLHHLQFNVHNRRHVVRAAQEGIAYALAYGMDLLRQLGVQGLRVRAGYATMFLSPVFREAFVNTVDLTLELYDTDGAQGAARGAGIGVGIYASPTEALASLRRLRAQEPDPSLREQYQAAYHDWRTLLEREIS